VFFNFYVSLEHPNRPTKISLASAPRTYFRRSREVLVLHVSALDKWIESRKVARFSKQAQSPRLGVAFLEIGDNGNKTRK